MKLADLAQQIQGTFECDGEIEIRGVAGISEAAAGEISFLANPHYASKLALTHAAAVIVSNDWEGEAAVPLIRVENPDAAFAQAALLFYTPPTAPVVGVHPSAVVGSGVELGEGVSVGPLCVIEDGVRIGAGTVIMAQCYVGNHSSIGENCRLYPQVSLRESIQIGNRTIVHNGTVLGSDGFGYSVDDQGVRTKIPQIGIVDIGDDVEIGANVTIDRARFGRTRIGNGVKIDNLVQIAHNVVIGDHVVIVSQVGIAGSAIIEEKVIMAGQAGVAGHLTVGAGAIIGPRAGVTKPIPAGQHVMGMPAIPIAKMMKSRANVMLLPRLKSKVSALEKKLAELESRLK